MELNYLLGAFALTLSTAAFAAEPPSAPKKECCCKTDEHGKMACCQDKAEAASDDHAGHAMGGMDHK